MQKKCKVAEECGVGHVAVDDWKRKTSETSELCPANASFVKV
jgi:transposase